MLAQIDPNGTAAGNGADPSPLKEAEGELVMGGGEGDEDLGDDVGRLRVRAARQIEVADASASADPAAPGGEAEEAGGTLVVPMPEMGESVTEGTVLEWHVAEGQQRRRGRHGDRGLDRQGRRRGPGAGERHDHEASGQRPTTPSRSARRWRR